MNEDRREPRKENGDKMETLKEKGIVSFNIELTPEERNAIQQIKIEKELEQFNYYGPANEKLVQQLTAHFSQLEGNTKEAISAISSLVARVAEGTQKDFNQESAWVMVRVTLPKGEYDKVARWHKDGGYVDGNYKDNQGNLKNGKLVFNIRGDQTRFAKLKDGEYVDENGDKTTYQKKWDNLWQEDGNNYDKNYDKTKKEYEQSNVYKQEDLRIRKALEHFVEELPPFGDGQAVLYRTGADDAEIHSEPKDDPNIAEPRIFMSVVTGSIKEIEKFEIHYEKK